MPKKRVPVRSKIGISNDVRDINSSSITDKNVPVTSLNKNISQHSDQDNGQTSSLIRVAFMAALLLGLAGILFFPKLVYLAETTLGIKSENTPGGQGQWRESRGREEAAQENIVSFQNVKDTVDTEGDLMENEETETHTRNSDNMKTKKDSLHRNTNRAEQDTGSRKTITKKSENDAPLKPSDVETNNAKTCTKRSEQADKTPPRTGRSGSGKPIVLNSETSHVVLDPSQIKFVDSPEDSNIDATNSKVNAKKDKPSTNKAGKHNSSTLDMKDESVEKNIDDEIRNFQPTFHKTFTPKKIFDGGRRIPPVELLHQKPSNSSVKVFLFDDFLSVQECDGLMRAHDNHVKAANKTPILCFDSVDTLRKHIKDAKKSVKVTPNVFTPGTRCLNESFSLQLGSWLKSNWSYSTAFYPGESTFSKIAAVRIQNAMGLDPISGGKFQITSYPLGKAYKEHTDCVLEGVDKRDRVVTVLMYLNDVEEGGETKFPELGIWVKPKKGRALVWNNMSPDGVCEAHSKHVASVVKKGSKYILIRWYYYKTFYSLGRRPVAPHLPAREPDQAMVMCDVYNSGSCRWYDEWSYEHLLEYEKNKLTLI